MSAAAIRCARRQKSGRKHLPKLQTEGGFRLIRAFTVDHNAERLRKHCDRLVRELRQRPHFKKIGMRMRRLKQARKGGPQ